MEITSKPLALDEVGAGAGLGGTGVLGWSNCHPCVPACLAPRVLADAFGDQMRILCQDSPSAPGRPPQF